MTEVKQHVTYIFIKDILVMYNSNLFQYLLRYLVIFSQIIAIEQCRYAERKHRIRKVGSIYKMEDEFLIILESSQYRYWSLLYDAI